MARLAELADEDAAAYAAFMADRNDETRARTIEVPLAVAECCDEAAALAEQVRAQLSSAVAATPRRARRSRAPPRASRGAGRGERAVISERRRHDGAHEEQRENELLRLQRAAETRQ